MMTNEIVMYLFALVIAIPIHEFAHARSAVSYGDETPRLEGRLTIFPWDHFDPLGALMCVFTAIYGIGLGWGKPVNVNPAALRHPRWDGVKIAAWGPLSNLLLAIGFAVPLRFGWLAGNPGMDQLFLICVAVNLGLMLFNLIPIHPLDGSKVLAGFLPDEAAYRYGRFMVQYGPFLLLGLVFAGSRLGIFNVLISEPRRQIMSFLLGDQF
jgi:Zn-dependent protease